jgi:hypothetical protein
LTRPDEGSVMVETLVALTCVSLVLGAVFALIGQAAARRAALSERRMALLVARSELDAAGITIPLRGGPVTGRTIGLTWLVSPGAAPGEGLIANGSGPLSLVTVTVRETPGGPALARLSGLRFVETGL